MATCLSRRSQPCSYHNLRLLACKLVRKRGGGGVVTKSGLTLATPGTVAHQAPLFMGFPRQEYWSGLPFLSARDLPDLGIEPVSPVLQEESLPTNFCYLYHLVYGTLLLYF